MGLKIPGELAHGGEDYRFLGVDEENKRFHYYRQTPEAAEILLATPQNTEEDILELGVDDRLVSVEGDPFQILQQYQHQRQWLKQGDLVDHEYRTLTDPEHASENNTKYGGSLLLDDGRYEIPFRLPFSQVAQILESEAPKHQTQLNDHRPEHLELTPEESVNKYRLNSEDRGHYYNNQTTILDEIQVLDRGSNRVYDTFPVDELARDHFEQQLTKAEGIDSSLSELLVDDYTNLRGVSWATTSDVTYLENKYGVRAHEMMKHLKDADVYRNEHSDNAGVLNPPEHRDDMKRYLQNPEEREEDDGLEQAGFDDF